MCSGRGTCVCGTCICDPPNSDIIPAGVSTYCMFEQMSFFTTLTHIPYPHQITNPVYYGEACEFENFLCPINSSGVLCSGTHYALHLASFPHGLGTRLALLCTRTSDNILIPIGRGECHRNRSCICTASPTSGHPYLGTACECPPAQESCLNSTTNVSLHRNY